MIIEYGPITPQDVYPWDRVNKTNDPFNNSNFYMDCDSLEELIDVLNKSIDSLRELYFNLENKINVIENDELWEGRSFAEFKNRFDSWKNEYLKRLVELIELKNFVQNVIDTADVLIQQRDDLSLCLK